MAFFSSFESHATITTTERSLVTDSTSGVPGANSGDSMMRISLDLALLAAGDEFELRIYSKVNGGTQRTYEVFPLVGTYATLLVLPEIWLSDGFDVTLKKIAGADRDIRWALINDQRQDIVSLYSIIAGLPSAAMIATEVGAIVIEGTETLVQTLRLLTSAVLGKADIDEDAGTYTYYAKDGVTARIVGTIVGTIRALTTRNGA